ncbi:MAG: hypothetical protein WBG71_14890 [Leeuwenhoekiella sp.]
MILNATKEYFVKRKYIKLLARTTGNRPFGTIESVGLIYNAKHFVEKPDWSSLVGFLPKNTTVKAVCFMDEKPSETPDNVLFFNEKDIGGLGKIKNPAIAEFTKTPFDLLVGYFDTENLFLNLLVAQSQAQFKAGLRSEEPKLYDLMINSEEGDRDQFIIELHKYLKILKRLD